MGIKIEPFDNHHDYFPFYYWSEKKRKENLGQWFDVNRAYGQLKWINRYRSIHVSCADYGFNEVLVNVPDRIYTSTSTNTVFFNVHLASFDDSDAAVDFNLSLPVFTNKELRLVKTQQKTIEQLQTEMEQVRVKVVQCMSQITLKHESAWDFMRYFKELFFKMFPEYLESDLKVTVG